MKKIIAVSLLTTITMVGCMQIGGQAIPEPRAGFQATNTLPYTKAKVYQASLDALNESGVIILNEKKDVSISTDYVAGPTQLVALGILGTNSTRYKYLITLSGTDKKVVLNVKAFLESSADTLQSWRDVSGENAGAVKSIQDALIEKIESKLN